MLVCNRFMRQRPVDYHNSQYTLCFKKHSDEYYFDQLEALIARYSSANNAHRLVRKLITNSRANIETGKATVISICLDYLTTYIYDNIKSKRERAITDMQALCVNALLIKNTTAQNIFIRDEIYFYFNAKYGRPGFVEQKHDGTSLPASMPDDHNTISDVSGFVQKYMNLVDDNGTGEFVNNIKHLRGSCQRMLRAYPDDPRYLLLNGYALGVMGIRSPRTAASALTELDKG